MTYADNYNIRTTSVKFNDVADALDGLITRNYAGLTTGTSTAYIATPSPAWDAYTTSGLVVIIPHVTNSGAATINISSLGARDLRIGNAPIAAGVLQQNVPTIMAYTGTYFEVLLQNVSIPIGTIYTYAGASAPTGYLLCDGSPQSTTGAYAALHGVIGYTYGGSGGTFNLPDLRRRVPIGKGASDTLGSSDGVAYASRSSNQSHSVPPHYHGMGTGATLSVDISHNHPASTVNGTVGGSDGIHGHAPGSLATTGGTHEHNYVYRNQVEVVNAGTGIGNIWRLTSTATTTGGGAHSHGFTGTVGGTDGGHGHSFSLVADGQTLGVTAKTPTGTIGLGASGGGVDGNAAMTSGAGQYLYINYIIKT